jgi:hypothetical protein
MKSLLIGSMTMLLSAPVMAGVDDGGFQGKYATDPIAYAPHSHGQKRERRYEVRTVDEKYIVWISEGACDVGAFGERNPEGCHFPSGHSFYSGIDKVRVATDGKQTLFRFTEQPNYGMAIDKRNPEVPVLRFIVFSDWTTGEIEAAYRLYFSE